MIASSEPLNKVLGFLKGVKQVNDGQSAQCPVPGHDDKHNSLSISTGDDGRVLLKCHAGCSINEICDAMGIQVSDLFRSKDRSVHHPISVTYDYTDEHGNLLFQKIRYEPKDFRCRVPAGKDTWNWKMNGVRRVLYNLPVVINSEIVFICEGEKDCNLLARHGHTATCNYDGASKWSPDYNQYLKNKVVYILPDNDVPGKKHAAMVYNHLKPVAADVRIVELPNLSNKGDVSDFFADGGTADQFNRAVADASEGLPESFSNLTDVKIISDQNDDTDNHEWGEVIPLDEMDLKNFPLDCIPACLSDFARIVREISASNQTPSDMAALLLLTIISACLGGKVNIVTNNRYTELATLFAAIFAPSGSRKSSVYHALMKPVISYQKRLRAEMKAEIEGNKNELDILKKSIEKLKKDIVKKSLDDGSDLHDELRKKELQLADFDKPTELPLIFMETDFTVESLAPKIKANGGSLALFDHEGAFWNEVAGRYSQGNSQTNDLILKSYDGDPVTISRIGRGDIFIDQCCLAIGLIVQPTKIEDLKNKKTLEETGLIPRFMLSVPKNNVGYRQIQTPAVPQHISDNYNERIESLLELRQYADITLTMEEKTIAMYMQYCQSIETRLREGQDLYPLCAWASKLTGRVARIAAALHCFSYPKKVLDSPQVAPEIMEYSIGLSEYLIGHAKATYQILNLSVDVKIARKILRTLERYASQDTSSQISKGDIWSRVKNSDKSIQTVAAIAGALEILIDHHYIRPVATDHRVGRPAEIYQLNEKYFSSKPTP